MTDADASVVIDYPPPGHGGPAGPNPAQAEAHAVEVDELMYGGAAGGGKTDYIIAEVLAVLIEYPGSAGAIFRRTIPQLDELGGITNRLLDRLPQPDVGTYNAVKHTWTLRNGSRLRLAACARDADVTKYQGAEWAIVAFDQLEQFTEFQYTYLLHRLRQSGTVAEAMRTTGYRPKAIASANPGGVGHGWVKRRFIDPFPAGRQPFRPAPTLNEPTPGVRVFIPAKLADNEANVDPGYRRQLEALPGDTRRAMLDGDWNVYAGQRFRTFSVERHVIDPERLRLPMGRSIPRAIGIDYGLSAPFCALWGAKLADDLIYVYRELYAPGLSPRQQAQAILAAEAPGERTRTRPMPAALDAACWNRSPDDPDKSHHDAGRLDGPPPSSIAATYVNNGVPVTKAVRGDGVRIMGAADVDDRLIVRPDGFPRLLISSACTNLIRTLPELPRSKQRPEDVDTSAEDHAYDALRYLLAKLGRGRPGLTEVEGITPPSPATSPARGPARRPAVSTGKALTGPIGDL